MNNIVSNSIEHDKLLNYLDNKNTNNEQKKFVKDFYMIFFNNSNYIVDSKIIQKWIIYHDKYNFKRFFQSFLKENVDYSSYKTHGKNEEYIFTLKAFTKMLIKYDSDLVLCSYLSDLERDINEYYLIYKDNLHNIEKNKLLEDHERLSDNKRSVIYIYNTDIRNKNKTPILKIGLTDNLQERVKTYTTSHPNGMVVYQEEIFKSSLKFAEKWLHHLLTECGYLVKSECFELPIDEAILWLKHVNSSLKLTKSVNRFNYLSEIVGKELYLIDNVISDKKVLHYDMSVQTDAIIEEVENEDEIKPFRIKKEPPKNIENFNNFIEQCCIIDKEAQVSSVDIIGKYRIWAKNASKEVYLDLLDYLKDIFKPIRLHVQDKEGVVNGYAGVKLVPEEPFKLPLSPSKYETFLFNNCVLSPSSKVLFADVKNEYKAWQKRVNDIDVSDNEIKGLKEFLNESKHLLKANVWCDSGNGSGYYGFSLKKDIPYIKSMRSATAKTVEKVDILSNEVVDSWSTIAKAAQVENIPSAKLSRMCKNKVVVNDNYYYRSI
jgi:hypothetical protein